MATFKRIFLFIAINILVVTTISILLNLFGVRPYLNAYGIDYQSLMIFCLMWGMGGAFISLALSRKMAKWIAKVRLIPENPSDPDQAHLVQSIQRLTQEAGIPMPEVGIYESKEINAFATGPSKKRSLIAVSTGLLGRMNQDEIEGVLAHEVSHIANGDMVTMTLLQGVVNAFVMFLARIAAFAISGLGKQKGERGSFFSYMMLTFLFEFVFMFFGMMVIAAYSRFREYRADNGGAKLAGKDKMIEALNSLRVMREIKDNRKQNQALAAFKISGSKRGLISLLSTHPPLEKRIERLQASV